MNHCTTNFCCRPVIIALIIFLTNGSDEAQSNHYQNQVRRKIDGVGLLHSSLETTVGADDISNQKMITRREFGRMQQEENTRYFCYDDDEKCSEDEYCDGKICSPRKGWVFESCHRDRMCSTELFCDESTGECKRKKYKDDFCLEDNECESNSCFDQVCLNCDGDRTCFGERYCDDNFICVAKKSFNQLCDFDSQCLSDMYCDYSDGDLKCLLRKTVNEPCLDSRQCLPKSYCNHSHGICMKEDFRERHGPARLRKQILRVHSKTGTD